MTEKLALKEIFLNLFHKKNSAKFVPFSGYSMPINYELGIIKENLQVRNSAGFFDVSHMGQILIEISNKNISSLEKFIPLNLNNIKKNKCYYSFLLNDKGGIIDDIIISKINLDSFEKFFIVYNAGRKFIDEKIFIDILHNYNFLNNNSLISIQGPLCLDVLNFLNLPININFMNICIVDYLNEKLIVSRTGYTGEDGFEISCPNNIIYKLIDNLFMCDHIKLCGLGSRDSLRLEAGLSLYGNELNENITPIEAGLSWALNKERILDIKLNGNQILKRQLDEGTKILKVGLTTDSKSILRSKMNLLDENQKIIGFITSGGYSPSLNTSIAIGYINNLEQHNYKILSSIRGSLSELKIVNLPFISHKYIRGK